MIRAAVAFAEGLSDPPGELQYLLDARRWSPVNPPLPLAGGWFDQPVRLMFLMYQQEAIVSLWTMWQASDRTSAWRKAHPAEWLQVKRIRTILREA